MAALFKFLCLIHKQIRSKHYSITDDIDLSSLEYAWRNAAKYIFLSFELQSVTRIRSSLEAGYDIIFRSKYIDYFSFPFVSTLKTQQNINFSCILLSEI